MSKLTDSTEGADPRLVRLATEHDAYAQWACTAPLGVWESLVCPVRQTPAQVARTGVQRRSNRS